MVECLKGKKYDFLGHLENLGPLLKNNFVDKLGRPFKNVSQSLNRMNNANRNSKPRLGVVVDEILDQLLPD